MKQGQKARKTWLIERVVKRNDKKWRVAILPQASFAEQLQNNKKELFNAYKQKINMYEQLMQMEDDDRALLNYD